MTTLSAGNNVFPWRWLALGALALLLAIVAPGCGGGGDDGGSGGGDPGDNGGVPLTDIQMRSQFIQSVGNGFILPTYASMAAAAADLIDDADTFCTNPNASNLSAAQAQWRAVVGLWVESELVKFGPEVRNLVHDDIDAPRGRHAAADRMEARIAGTGSIDARSLPVTQRGLEGVEYLLFGDMEDDSAIVADYTGSTGQRRCQYLEAIVDDLHANITKFYDSWRPGGDNYLDSWNTAGDTANSVYPFVQDAVRQLMGEMEFVLDDLVNVKIAGYKRGARRPWEEQKPESWRSGYSIANIRHRIEAAEMIYLGTDRDTNQNGFGIDDYLQRTGEAGLDSRIKDEFETVLGAGSVLGTLEGLGLTLGAAVNSHAALLLELEAESRTLLRTLKRDLTVNQLGVEFPGFNDADGD